VHSTPPTNTSAIDYPQSPTKLHAALEVVRKMHTAGLKGEPLAAIQSDIRNEWLETLDRAFEAFATIGASGRENYCSSRGAR
jgi:hypothetical protein